MLYLCYAFLEVFYCKKEFIKKQYYSQYTFNIVLSCYHWVTKSQFFKLLFNGYIFITLFVWTGLGGCLCKLVWIFHILGSRALCGHTHRALISSVCFLSECCLSKSASGPVEVCWACSPGASTEMQVCLLTQSPIHL